MTKAIEPSSLPRVSLSEPATLSTSRASYALSDELSRLCLPQEFRDPCRKLAWVNSICCLFLVVGLVGLKPPKPVEKPRIRPVAVVPVAIIVLDEPPKTEVAIRTDEPDQTPETLADTPRVVPVVAAASAPDAAFAVPVPGVVAIVPAARQASPPPVARASPKAVQFSPGTSGMGSYPPPPYPPLALRNRYQGTVVLEFTADPTGAVGSIKVQQTSGFAMLDHAAMDWVRSRWHFPAGTTRLYYWSCTFKLE